MSKIPVHCPSCSSVLSVTELSCENCQTRVSGQYTLPLLLRLSVEEQEFIVQFVRSSGSLKEMAVQMGKSYPTVRNKLDDLIARLRELEQREEEVNNF